MLLFALLLAAVAIYLGSQQRVPPPFGPARNGVIAYAEGGDLYVADPVTRTASAIVTGPEEDDGPRFSLDGTLVAFERKVNSGAASQIYVARTDGSNLTLVTQEPLLLAPGDVGRAWEKYEFSPDGKALLIATNSNGYATLTIAQTDGTGVRQLDVGMAASEPSFRSPGGTEILFIGIDGNQRGLFAVDPTGATVRQILLLAAGFDLAGASWSPDGSHIAYWSWGGEPGKELNAATHVIASDGSADLKLPSPPGAVWNAHATWSNDGTKLFIARGYAGEFEDVRGVVIPADGSDVGIEVARSVETECCAAWIWSPDDAQLLGRSTPHGSTGHTTLIDIAAKRAIPAPWGASDPTWQRLAR
jgi:Tol biopolymer transport system component